MSRLERLSLYTMALVAAFLPMAAFADDALGGAGTKDTPFEVWQLFLGAIVVPLVVAILSHVHWPPQRKATLLLVIAAATTVITMLLNGELDSDTALQDPFFAFMKVALAAGAAYLAVWKPLGVAPRIEAGVNKGSPPA